MHFLAPFVCSDSTFAFEFKFNVQLGAKKEKVYKSYKLEPRLVLFVYLRGIDCATQSASAD